MTDRTFGTRVRDMIAERGRLCVGIDPHAELLESWGLEQSAAGVREFGLRVVEATADRAGIVKPQVSFFERFGATGFAALEDVIRAARDAGLVVIADAKRGDIGTTTTGYAQAWLEPGAPLESDALTVNPYLGVGALAPAFETAQQHGKGLFVLAATSNPEAVALQNARAASGRSVSAEVIAEVSAFNAAHTPGGAWGSMGFVMGATVDLAARGIADAMTPPAPILAPGFGAQGARPEDVGDIFGALAPTVIAAESRGILRAGPDGIAAAIRTRIEELEVARG
ncbi:orotidine-5'-phosphate decarboxylase [Microbacterium gorillae]|uniref:orotidine-5'-phosphate decarboxylase n=1 Tax=Microbacterium gorillae TaxID=1231063 RepID=UPI00059013A4|nr:orotidine-5'-phosphate decarboxylase [Microbacterium gorillae]